MSELIGHLAQEVIEECASERSSSDEIDQVMMSEILFESNISVSL